MFAVILSHTISAVPAAGHNRAVESELPDAMRLPSGLNATLFTMSPCANGWPTGWPVSTSHNRTVLSKLVVAR
jgi:hypothetical protein